MIDLGKLTVQVRVRNKWALYAARIAYSVLCPIAGEQIAVAAMRRIVPLVSAYLRIGNSERWQLVGRVSISSTGKIDFK